MASLTLNQEDKIKTWGLLFAGLIIFASFPMIFSAVQKQAPHDQVPLGTWKNMPDVSQCDFTMNLLPSPTCELLGNTTQRGVAILENGAAMQDVIALLSVGCGQTISNTITASLELQYAIFNGITNITNWQSIGGQVFIDGVSFPGCTGTFTFGTSSTTALNNTLVNQGYIFRVVGGDGGGPGDNPSFTQVKVILEQNRPRLFVPAITAHSATGFTAQIAVTVPVTVSTLVNFLWIASNETVAVRSMTISGSGSCTIGAGNLVCTSAITYGQTFKTVPSVTVTSTSGAVGFATLLGIVNLLHAQTVTV